MYLAVNRTASFSSSW